ncbi:MAG: helix-turn-helix domain-containing protein [Candidatus Competibacteraceae bacterium]|nr:helix-turn-helix domain-containing protein [Candidatus Competibacteraceae bacterium]
MSCGGFKFEWQRAFMESDLPPGTRHVLHAICAYMDAEGGHCYPSRETLARVTGLSPNRITRHLQAAVDAGWLDRWARRESSDPLTGRAAQGWRHYQYQATIPKLVPHVDESQNVGTKLTHDTHERGQSVDTIRARLTPERRRNSCENVGTKLTHDKRSPEQNVGTKLTHDTHERGYISEQNVGKFCTPINQTISQTKNQGESQNAAYAASPTAEVSRTHNRTRKTPVPDNFVVSDEVKRWAIEKGYPEDRLTDYLEIFKDKAKAGGYRYANHDAAFKTCVREDWGHLRTQKGIGKITPLRGSTRAPTAAPEGGFLDFGRNCSEVTS